MSFKFAFSGTYSPEDRDRATCSYFWLKPVSLHYVQRATLYFHSIHVTASTVFIGCYPAEQSKVPPGPTIMCRVSHRLLPLHHEHMATITFVLGSLVLPNWAASQNHCPSLLYMKKDIVQYVECTLSTLVHYFYTPKQELQISAYYLYSEVQ